MKENNLSHFPLRGEARDDCNRKAQLAKDLKFERALELKLAEAVSPTEACEALAIKDAECQDRVERIFYDFQLWLTTYKEQALKKREGVE